MKRTWRYFMWRTMWMKRWVSLSKISELKFGGQRDCVIRMENLITLLNWSSLQVRTVSMFRLRKREVGKKRSVNPIELLFCWNKRYQTPGPPIWFSHKTPSADPGLFFRGELCCDVIRLWFKRVVVSDPEESRRVFCLLPPCRFDPFDKLRDHRLSDRNFDICNATIRLNQTCIKWDGYDSSYVRVVRRGERGRIFYVTYEFPAFLLFWNDVN